MRDYLVCRSLAHVLPNSRAALQVLERDRARRMEQSRAAATWVQQYEELMAGEAEGGWEDMPDPFSMFDEGGGDGEADGATAVQSPRKVGRGGGGRQRALAAAGPERDDAAQPGAAEQQETNEVDGVAEDDDQDEDLAAALEGWEVGEEEEEGAGAQPAAQQQDWYDEDDDDEEDWEDSEDEAAAATAEPAAGGTAAAVSSEQPPAFRVHTQVAAAQAAARALPGKRASTAGWLKAAPVASGHMPVPSSQPAKPTKAATHVPASAHAMGGQGKAKGTKRSQERAPDGSTPSKRARTSAQQHQGSGTAAPQGRGKGRGGKRTAAGAGRPAADSAAAVAQRGPAEQQATNMGVEQRVRSPSPSTAAFAEHEVAASRRGPVPGRTTSATPAATSSLATANDSSGDGGRAGMSAVTDAAAGCKGPGGASAVQRTAMRAARAGGPSVFGVHDGSDDGGAGGADDAGDAGVLRLARESAAVALATAHRAVHTRPAAPAALGRSMQPHEEEVEEDVQGEEDDEESDVDDDALVAETGRLTAALLQELDAEGLMGPRGK